MNKFLHLAISIFLWVTLTRSVINNNGFIGPFINKVGIAILPNGLLNISGPFFILIIFFILYAILFYLVAWKEHPKKED